MPYAKSYCVALIAPRIRLPGELARLGNLTSSSGISIFVGSLPASEAPLLPILRVAHKLRVLLMIFGMLLRRSMPRV